MQDPDWLMDAIEATCPLEDRTAERRVFLGLQERAARKAMAVDCKNADIPHFSPKDSGTAEPRSGTTAGYRLAS